MFSGLHFGAIVYEGFLPAAPEATGGDEPGSNVREIDDSRGRLGCGTHTAIITGTCGGPIVLRLDTEMIKLEYARVLNAASEAEIILNVGGDPSHSCLTELADVWPWCHELHIFRDGVHVWSGSVQQITYARNNITIRAKDHLVYTQIMQVSFDYNLVAGPLIDIVETAYDLTTHADAASDQGNFEVLDCTLYRDVVKFNSGVTGYRYIPNYTKSIYEWWASDFAEAGLQFTVVAGRFFFGDIGNNIPRLGAIRDVDFLGDIEVTKDGELQGNRWFVTYEGDAGDLPPGPPGPPFFTHIPAASESIETYCFPRIERLITDSGALDLASAQLTADAYVAARSVTPIVINVPDGSQLGPSTPVLIENLIPGSHLDVSITMGAFLITQTFKLQEMKVTEDSSGEKIQITVRSLGEG